MLVDSHCHLNFPDLAGNLPAVLDTMHGNGVAYALCVGVTLQEFPAVLAIAEQHANIFASVGVHPDYEDESEVSVEQLVSLAVHPRVVAIGETGLDYYRLQGDLEWQRARFRTHICAAIAAQKPLIIHTRSAAEDTLRIMREEGAERIGGVMHCFTESLKVAEQAIALGFYISFSGILTFKNATALKDVARRIPLERILVETDSPYLAPVPYRGKTNQPAYVKYVAEEIATLRGITPEAVAAATTHNFFELFKQSQPCA
ncbi:MAG TPA: TatD family hydrolase [Methylophilaceae bacterium]|nr:TatD family hydrolase [Methylophilaceae bacterium]